MSIAEVGAGVAGIGKGSEGIIGAIGSLFGSSGSQSGSSSGTAKSTTSSTLKGKNEEFLDISDDAITKIISDVLSGPDGLAAIFAGEQATGLYNSSTANQAAGDLTAKLVGEIAKLRAKKINTADQTQEQITEQEQQTTNAVNVKDKGVLGSIGDFFGF